jgi:hypothetical protein
MATFFALSGIAAPAPASRCRAPVDGGAAAPIATAQMVADPASIGDRPLLKGWHLVDTSDFYSGLFTHPREAVRYLTSACPSQILEVISTHFKKSGLCVVICVI